MLAVERERARRKGYGRDVFDTRTVARDKARDAPLFRFPRHIFVLAAANDEKRSIDKRVPANFRAHVDCALNFSRNFDLMHISFVPLTEVKMLAVEAQVRADEVRAGEELHEAIIRRIAINVTIVI